MSKNFNQEIHQCNFKMIIFKDIVEFLTPSNTMLSKLLAKSIVCSPFSVQLSKERFSPSNFVNVCYGNTEMIFMVDYRTEISFDEIGMSTGSFGNFNMPHNSTVTVFTVEKTLNLIDVDIEISNTRTGDTTPITNMPELIEELGNLLKNTVVNPNQIVQFAKKRSYQLKFLPIFSGIINENTKIHLLGNLMKLSEHADKLLKLNQINFHTLGVGGLEDKVESLFTEVFLSRLIPKKLQEKLNIKHVKGVLLYGPPGCGKTRLARSLVSNVNATVKIINAGELLSKYVGESGKNVGELFEPARKNPDKLHVIVFDECDALFQERRGGDDVGNNVNRQVVNRLLAEIDGIDSAPNVIIIGATNRIDLIDPAILRPGRLEVQLEIPLPDEKGRLEIFTIHSDIINKNKMFGSTVNFAELAKITQGFTGAEIEKVVWDVVRYVIRDQVTFDKIADIQKICDTDIKIEQKDFISIIKGIIPQFGSDALKIRHYLENSPQLSNSCFVTKFSNEIRSFFTSVDDPISRVKTYCLFGDLTKYSFVSHASWAVSKANVQFVRILDPSMFIGETENNNIRRLIQVFHDAYATHGGVIILDRMDDIARISRDGMRYDNSFILALISMIHSALAHVKRLMIIMTARRFMALRDVGLFDEGDGYNVQLEEIRDDENSGGIQ